MKAIPEVLETIKSVANGGKKIEVQLVAGCDGAGEYNYMVVAYDSYRNELVQPAYSYSRYSACLDAIQMAKVFGWKGQMMITEGLVEAYVSLKEQWRNE